MPEIIPDAEAVLFGSRAREDHHEESDFYNSEPLLSEAARAVAEIKEWIKKD